AQEPLPSSVQVPFVLAKRLAATVRGIERVGSEPARGGDGAEAAPEAGGEAGSLVAAVELSDVGTQVAEQMRRWRRKMSAALGIPAYRVLNNVTIDRIASALPRSLG